MLDLIALEKDLGPGPVRFAHKDERSIADQIASLDASEKQCFDELKGKWQAKHPEFPFSDEMYLRFARCSPGKKKFTTNKSWGVMKKFDHRYLSLTAESMEKQLLSKVCHVESIAEESLWKTIEWSLLTLHYRFVLY
jgi:hypothetical protein